MNQPMKQRGLRKDATGVSASSSSDDASGLLPKKPAVPSIVRADVPLQAVQPHLIEAMKKKVIVAIFSAVGLDFQTVSLIQVLQWLFKNKYTDSEDGRQAIGAGLKAIFEYLGATDRVKVGDVGTGTVVSMSIGHYALAACFVRHCLELAVMKAYKKSTRRTGAEPGLYIRWRAELLRVHKFLESDNDASLGLALTDGAERDRAVLNTSGNEMVEHIYEKQKKDDDGYIKLLTRLQAEEEQRKQREARQRA